MKMWLNKEDWVKYSTILRSNFVVTQIFSILSSLSEGSVWLLYIKFCIISANEVNGEQY